METLVHIEPDGEVYLDPYTPSWARVVDGNLYVGAHPKAVHFDGDDDLFLAAPLQYAPWHPPEAEVELRAGIFTLLASLALAAPRLHSRIGRAGQALKTGGTENAMSKPMRIEAQSRATLRAHCTPRSRLRGSSRPSSALSGVATARTVASSTVSFGGEES